MIYYFVEPNKYFTPIVDYIFRRISKNYGLSIDKVNNEEQALLIYSSQSLRTCKIDQNLWDLLENRDYKKINEEINFQIETKKTIDQIDVFFLSFYLINCLQEFDDFNNDQFNRYTYSGSIQQKQSIIHENYIDQLFRSLFSSFSIELSSQKSSIFISHDIDSIYGAFLQDGLWAMKKGRFDILLKLIFNELIRNPHWRNIDQILKIHDEYSIKSTFFWLVNKGKGVDNVMNSDYQIAKQKDLLNKVKANNSINGLHKSASNQSYRTELDKSDFLLPYNRHHFLKFNPQTYWKKMEDDGIEIDCSLGFAEQYGFRNSYGLPFQPYNFNEKTEMNLLEVPLQMMDGTFQKYLKLTPQESADKIIQFIDKNKENAVLSLLWHNTYFTQYKYGKYSQIYLNILEHLKTNNFETINLHEIKKKYLI